MANSDLVAEIARKAEEERKHAPEDEALVERIAAMLRRNHTSWSSCRITAREILAAVRPVIEARRDAEWREAYRFATANGVTQSSEDAKRLERMRLYLAQRTEQGR